MTDRTTCIPSVLCPMIPDGRTDRHWGGGSNGIESAVAWWAWRRAYPSISCHYVSSPTTFRAPPRQNSSTIVNVFYLHGHDLTDRCPQPVEISTQSQRGKCARPIQIRNFPATTTRRLSSSKIQYSPTENYCIGDCVACSLVSPFLGGCISFRSSSSKSSSSCFMIFLPSS
jgi:hypothetical protein